ERPSFAQEAKRPPEEMGDEIGVPVRAGVERLEPVEISTPRALGERVLPGERRVAHHRVEAGVWPLEHLGELYLPVKWRHGVLPLAQRRRAGLLRLAAEAALPAPLVLALEER